MSQVQLRPGVPREMAKTEASLTCPAGCDAIANPATTAASTFCASRRSLIGRAAQPGTCLIGRGASLRGPLFDSFRVGWSVGHVLVHLPL
jgi:hypothetical protein